MIALKKVKKVIAKPNEIKQLLDVSCIDNLKCIEINTRKFIQFDFDFTHPGRSIEIPKINLEEIKDSIVKVNIKINQEDLYKINIKELESYLKDYAYILRPIIPQIVKSRRVRMKKLTTDLNPIKAVEVWLTEKKHKNSKEIFAIADDIIRSVGIK